MRTKLFFGMTVAILLVCNGLIIQKERLKSSGRVVFLKLAPRDPRSLLQGDYMALNYALNDDLRAVPTLPVEGEIVVKLDEKNIGKFVRVHTGEVLQASEQLLRFHGHDWQIQVAPPAFYFQEGLSKVYERAEYGELRVSPSGECLLVGLRAGDLKELGPEK